MRRWKIWLLVTGAAVTIGLFLCTTGAGAATRNAVPRLWGGGAACRTLMSNPDAVKAMQALRAEHRLDMQAWWQKYGSDPTSAAAQKAMQQLRQEHWYDMQQLFKKFGVTVPESGSQGGYGPGMMGSVGRSGGAGGGCWRGSAPAPGVTATPGASTSSSSYGAGMMGGGYGAMMGQSL